MKKMARFAIKKVYFLGFFVVKFFKKLKAIFEKFIIHKSI